MENIGQFGGVDFGAASCSGLCKCTAIISQIRAEVEESVKRGMEAPIRQIDEAFSKLQSLIPALVKEAVTESKASIPESVQVEEASRAVTGFLISDQSFPPPFTTRGSPQEDESSNLCLKFAGHFPENKSLFTKEDIKDQGASLTVELHDRFGQKVEAGPESSAKIKIFVVDGDFIEDGDEDISKHVVTPREGKPALLKGKIELSLSKGVGSVGEFAFTDNSSSTRSGMFKLGVQVIKGVSPRVSIKAAVSDGFKVKEHRNTFNRKQQISPDDEVWHLVNIGKGKIHKKLESKGIILVKDFVNTDYNELLQIFRGDKKKLNKTIEMAKSCSESALPIQSQMIPDNSQKHLLDMLSEKQSEQTHIPYMINLTADVSEPFCSTPLSPIMAATNPSIEYQGEPADQSDGISDRSWTHLEGMSNEKQSEQTHIPYMINPTADVAEPFCSTPLSRIMAATNPIAAYQGEPADQSDGISTLSWTPWTALYEDPQLAELWVSFSETSTQNMNCSTSASNIVHLNATGADQGMMPNQAEEDSFDLSEYLNTPDKESNELIDRPSSHPAAGIELHKFRMLLVRAVIRFRISVKVKTKESPRAGKRQKLG